MLALKFVAKAATCMSTEHQRWRCMPEPVRNEGARRTRPHENTGVKPPCVQNTRVSKMEHAKSLRLAPHLWAVVPDRECRSHVASVYRFIQLGFNTLCKWLRHCRAAPLPSSHSTARRHGPAPGQTAETIVSLAAWEGGGAPRPRPASRSAAHHRTMPTSLPRHI
jgi:hypothetical protein